jgi:hypothetical protein
MQNSKFVGVCLLISSLILSAAIVYHAKASIQITLTANGRYQFQSSNPPGVIWVIDTTTGEVKTQHG